jgi:argininosuccinate lyase
MKLWQKTNSSPSGLPADQAGDADKRVEQFTVGKDREMDRYLAAFDVLGSLAHIQMLQSIGLLTKNELPRLQAELKSIYSEIEAGNFKLQEDVEDIHSQIELLLTKRLGDVGKKIHSARSRNDQVLVDIKLFLRNEIEELVKSIQSFFELLQSQSENYKEYLLPGYTHLQLAMPSSFGLWFGAYAESLVDDTITLKAAYDVANKNPLGSGAGYGSSFPINRTLTTKLLGFDDLNYNVVYAQMGRGKTERITAMALANVADTLSKLSMDACLYLNQNFGFISFPAELTTGSSIMPHKKNPDVFELIRSYCNRIKALPNEIMLMTTNLPSGYHRDLQLLKEHLFPAFGTLKDCIEMAALMLSGIEIKKDILLDEKYKYLFTVDEVNNLVMQGIPFRDAYKIIAQKVEDGSYIPPSPEKMGKGLHEGSIGYPATEEIKKQMEKITDSFPFKKVETALTKLLQ